MLNVLIVDIHLIKFCFPLIFGFEALPDTIAKLMLFSDPNAIVHLESEKLVKSVFCGIYYFAKTD